MALYGHELDASVTPWEADLAWMVKLDKGDFSGRDVLDREKAEGPRRLPDESLWIMFESALPFRETAWARETPLLDPTFLPMFEGMRSRFDPKRP